MPGDHLLRLLPMALRGWRLQSAQVQVLPRQAHHYSPRQTWTALPVRGWRQMAAH